MFNGKRTLRRTTNYKLLATPLAGAHAFAYGHCWLTVANCWRHEAAHLTNIPWSYVESSRLYLG